MLRFGRLAVVARVAGALAICVVLAVGVVSPVLGRSHAKVKEGTHPSCHGLANAYAHGGKVAEVAAKHGCDLTGITPVEHPVSGNNDKDETEDPGRPDGDEGKGPPADVVAAKCDRIADKLTAAEARPHGKSAAAFARQADKWSCD